MPHTIGYTLPFLAFGWPATEIAVFMKIVSFGAQRDNTPVCLTQCNNELPFFLRVPHLGQCTAVLVYRVPISIKDDESTLLA